MKSMTSNGKLLAQDDVDAILAQAGLEGDYDEEAEEEHTPEQNRQFHLKRRTDEEVRDITRSLFNRAFLERESDVAVIWNAAGVIPMQSGASMKIQDVDYMTLGVLHEKHLVIACQRG